MRERGGCPDPVDPDDEDADPSVKPEKVEVPEVAFKPIVRFGFDKRDTREAARLPAPCSQSYCPRSRARGPATICQALQAVGLPAAASCNHEEGGGRK